MKMGVTIRVVTEGGRWERKIHDEPLGLSNNVFAVQILLSRVIKLSVIEAVVVALRQVICLATESGKAGMSQLERKSKSLWCLKYLSWTLMILCTIGMSRPSSLYTTISPS
jgi:hypothetical protein